MQHLRGRTAGITELAVSPDSRYVAAGGNACGVWDLHAARPKPKRAADGLARRLSFATPTVLLFAGDAPQSWLFYDAATGPLSPVPGNHLEGVAARAPDGLVKVATCEHTSYADRSDVFQSHLTTGLVTGGNFAATDGPREFPLVFEPCGFQPGGEWYLAQADADYGLYDAATDELAVAFAVPRGRAPISTVFGADGARLFAVHYFGIDGYDCATGGPVVSLAWPDPSVPRPHDRLAFHPAGRLASTAEGGGGVTFRDAETLEVRRVYDFAMPKVNAVAFTPDGTRVAIGNSRGKVLVFDVDD